MGRAMRHLDSQPVAPARGVETFHWARATNENVMDSVHAPVRALSVTIDEWDPNLSDAHSVNGDGAHRWYLRSTAVTRQ